ncbi:MAG: replication restart helicase PriA, partial [Desulforhopalus sp.]
STHNRRTIAAKDIRRRYSRATKALHTLAEKKIIISSQERVYRNPFGRQISKYPRPEKLTGEQRNVVSQLQSAIATKEFKPFLLHGVTGSGKTEVYLRAAEETLTRGRDVLILVPEIALATQLEAQLLSRFGDLVVLMHSALSPRERYDQFSLALSGKAKIVIGARSAVFAPLKDPGLIVVDEEHDSSFKQDDSFRYHGRDLAVLRAKHHDAVVVLGSATPSVISYSHSRNGKYSLLTMNERAGGGDLPTVTIVDLNSKRCKETKGIIKQELLARLQRNLTNKKQSVLLLNRRGFSAVVLCQSCGTPVQCVHCHVSLTLHKGRGRLICHYCGFSAAQNTVCVQCRSTDLVPVGFGTERLEEEVVGLLPGARVCRLDSDTARDRKKFLSVLSDMHDGKIDILIGTQIIAKGHHFPGVSQVGVVWADAGLSMPDFRAAERTFQLITQVTGRAGRGDTPGEVIIQTMRPDHYALVFAQQHQYQEMYEREIMVRQKPAFPPFVRLVCLRLQGRVESQVQQSANRVARFSRELAGSMPLGVQTLGPAPSPLDKIKDHFRWQIMLKSRSSEQLHILCNAIKAEEKALLITHCTLIIDVDPENML